MRKIALVGHKRTMNPIADVIKRFYKDVEVVEIEYVLAEINESAIEYIKFQIEGLDGIIYTGYRPYAIINGAMGIEVPQSYVHHDQSILLQSILEAKTVMDFDIRSFSCDSYEAVDIQDAFKGFGFYSEELAHYTAPKNSISNNLVRDLYVFHKENYEKGRVSFCMTGVSMVYEKLNDENIPCILMQLTSEAIINAVNQLFLTMNAIESSESQIVVLSMEMDLPGEYSLIHDNEYQMLLEKSKVLEHVYKFAERLQAAVVETGSKNIILISTRQILETVTDKLNSMPILQTVSHKTAHTVSIGIGYGKTAKEAKNNAGLALNKALSMGGNQAFSYSDGKYSDPIYPDLGPQEIKIIVDPLYKTISEATGISVNNIYRLHCITEKLKKDRFTSGELSEAFGNTRRSMNRIIEKLEKAGYARVDGTRMMSDSGRPTRIIRLMI